MKLLVVVTKERYLRVCLRGRMWKGIFVDENKEINPRCFLKGKNKKNRNKMQFSEDAEDMTVLKKKYKDQIKKLDFCSLKSRRMLKLESGW